VFGFALDRCFDGLVGCSEDNADNKELTGAMRIDQILVAKMFDGGCGRKLVESGATLMEHKRGGA
jgi:hypothetical protein